MITHAWAQESLRLRLRKRSFVHWLWLVAMTLGSFLVTLAISVRV